MNKFAPLITILLLAGCAAPPPVRIASSILSRTVLKKAKEDYQKAHPKASPTPSPSPTPAQ
jgi:NifU-like protein involved in Fe-S cluster formation